MGLFRRKTVLADDAPRCPECGERVPGGAGECAMCGRDLHDLRGSGDAHERETDEREGRGAARS